MHSIDGYDVRAQVLGIVAQHLKPGMWFKVRDEVGDGAFRRLAQKVDLELLARLAKSDCLGRAPGVFNCDAMDWFLERARALGVEHRPPAPILLGRHLLELGVKPGPARRRDPEGRLRAAARWSGDDARRSDRRCASDCCKRALQARRHADRSDAAPAAAPSSRTSWTLTRAVVLSSRSGGLAPRRDACCDRRRRRRSADLRCAPRFSFCSSPADLRAIADGDDDHLLRHEVLLRRRLRPGPP